MYLLYQLQQYYIFKTKYWNKSVASVAPCSVKYVEHVLIRPWLPLKLFGLEPPLIDRIFLWIERFLWFTLKRAWLLWGRCRGNSWRKCCMRSCIQSSIRNHILPKKRKSRKKPPPRPRLHSESRRYSLDFQQVCNSNEMFKRNFTSEMTLYNN